MVGILIVFWFDSRKPIRAETERPRKNATVFELGKLFFEADELLLFRRLELLDKPQHDRHILSLYCNRKLCFCCCLFVSHG
jgi:hypothetical protein